MLLANVVVCESHAEQLRNSVSPFSHWFVLRLNWRVLLAIAKLATVLPLPIVFSSGSFVRFPMMVMIVSPAIYFSCFPSVVV